AGAALAALAIAAGPPAAPAVVRVVLHVDTGAVAERLPGGASTASPAAALTAHARPATHAAVPGVGLQAHTAPGTGSQRVRAREDADALVTLEVRSTDRAAAHAVVGIALGIGAGTVAKARP